MRFVRGGDGVVGVISKDSDGTVRTVRDTAVLS
jgi:hypothetical protein